MSDVDPRLVAALQRQLARRPAGARRVGWKVGQGERESVGRGIVVGRLTSATLLGPGRVTRARRPSPETSSIARLPSGRPSPPEDAEAALVVNGAERRRRRVPAETVGRIGEVERVLRDRVITGSVVQTSVSRGDRVVAEIEGLGRVELTIA